MMRLESLLGGGTGNGSLSSVLVVVVSIGTTVGPDARASFVVGVGVVTVLVLVFTSNLGLELGQRDGRQDGVLVNDRSVVNLLVNGDGGVNVGVLDGLPVDDRLDGLVDVVVDVLGGNGRGGGQASLGLTDLLGVPVEGSLLLELLPVLGEHVVLGLPGHLGDNIVLVLSGQSLLVDNGLNSVLVVVNVPLPVDGLDLLDGLVTGDVLLDDGGGGLGADLGRVGLVGSRQEGLDVVDDSAGGRSVVNVGVGRHFDRVGWFSLV